MEHAGGLEEAGIIVGNLFNKYETKNPVARALVANFVNSVESLVKLAKPFSVHEVGCGEGYWALKLSSAGLETKGTDFSKEVISIAKRNASAASADPSIFSVTSIYELASPAHDADLILCLEVLEHLEDPSRALKALRLVTGSHLLISVPREPIWRVLNLSRGKYLSTLGNTPGHLQNWSSRGFMNLVREHFEIVEVRKPLPWTMLLCKPRR